MMSNQTKVRIMRRRNGVLLSLILATVGFAFETVYSMKLYAQVRSVAPIAQGAAQTTRKITVTNSDKEKAAEASFQAGETARKQGHLPTALREYSKSIRLVPQNATAYSRRAEVYDQLGKRWLAYVDVQMAVKLEPEKREYRRQLEELLHEPVDLRTWKQQGDKRAGDWRVSEDGKYVRQLVNGDPTFLVSPETFIDTTVKGKFEVGKNWDDDYIGFVFGFQSPISQNGDAVNSFDFLIFDWKQATQSSEGIIAQEGFSLVRVRGQFDRPASGEPADFWGHESSPTFDVLATKFDPDSGWKDATEYEFALQYTRDRILISIDGQQIFDVHGEFLAGRFGFYNYSQSDVRYTGFTKTTLEPPPALVTVKSSELSARFLPAIELIVDSSGSMNELIGQTPKYQSARKVIDRVLEELKDDRQVGLRLFGYWGRYVLRIENPKAAAIAPNDPRLNKDSQLVVPIAPFDSEQRAQMKRWLDSARPRGKTPLVYSLLEANRDFSKDQNLKKTIVLISDGKETCGGRIEDVAEAFKKSDIDVVIHVVGFDVEKDEEAVKQLLQIATQNGGKFFKAGNPEELTTALRAAVNVRYEVIDSTTDKVIANGIVDGEPVELEQGKYRVRLTDSSNEPVAVELPAAILSTLVLDESGKIRLTDTVAQE